METNQENQFKSSADVASGLQWVRWKTQGGRSQDRPGALLLLAIGANSVSASMDLKMDAEDAIAILTEEMDTIAKLLRYMQETRKTHHYAARAAQRSDPSQGSYQSNRYETEKEGS